MSVIQRTTLTELPNLSAAQQAAMSVRKALPSEGLFAGHEWRTSPAPFALGADLAQDLEKLGRVLLQFYRAVNLLYRQSAEGKQPAWVARWLDQGKPSELIQLQRSSAFKNDVPRVIRPDLLLTENGFSVTELDSVPPNRLQHIPVRQKNLVYEIDIFRTSRDQTL